MENIFVTGATGFIGKNLIPELLQNNYSVTALVRTRSDFSFLKQLGIKVVIGDILEPSFYSSALSGATYAINLAGVVTDWAPVDRYAKVHISGLEFFLDECNKARVKKVIHISTIDVLDKGKRGSITLTDESPMTKSSIPYDRTKALGEELALSYSKRMEVIVLRPSWVYGVGDTTLFPEIAFQTKKNQMVLIGSKEKLIPLVHVKNLSQAIILAIRKRGVTGQTFLISDGEKTWKYICDAVADAVGGKKPKVVIPYGPAMILGTIMEFVGRLTRQKKRPLLTRTAVEMLGVSLRVDASKAEKVLGYKSIISLNEGIPQVLRWLAQSDIASIRMK